LCRRHQGFGRDLPDHKIEVLTVGETMRHVTTCDGLTFRPHTFFNRLSGRTCSSTLCGFLAAIRRPLAFRLGLYDCGRGTFIDMQTFEQGLSKGRKSA